MENNTSGVGPQNTRRSPAIVEWEFSQEGFPDTMPEPGYYLPAQVEDIPYEPVAENTPAQVERPDAVEIVIPVAQITRVTVQVVKVAAPVMIGGGVLYGLFLALSWLVVQTLFWMILLGLAAGLIFLSLFLESVRDGRPNVPAKKDPAGGNVTTNVHVIGGKGDVTTNVFVHYDNQAQ